jgi:hypothetical protein
MSTHWLILGEDNTFTQLAYVIAVLVLAGLGAVADRVRKKQEEAKRYKRPETPKQSVPPTVTKQPEVEDWTEILIPKPVPRQPLVRKPQPKPKSAHPQPQAVPRKPVLARPIETAAKVEAKPVTAPVSARPSTPAAPKTPIARPPAIMIGPVRQLAVQDLQKAFVWSEILQPPVALRDSGRF